MTSKATFGGGCFWCIEAAFQELDGVETATSGYAGGHTEDPSYRAVCAGTTGHAEVVQLEYDATAISYEELLDVFFTVHDPTQRNRQGPDVGPQYRSIVLTHDDDQQRLAASYVDTLDEAGGYDDEVVTEVEPLETFWRAEETHQDYFATVSTADGTTTDAYCQVNVVPKIETVRERFADKVKAEPDA